KQLNSMTRFFGLLLIGGVGLIVMGAYGFFIQADTASTPTTVSIADLEGAAPSDRHLIVTGGRALVNDAVVYYETRRYAKVAGSGGGLGQMFLGAVCIVGAVVFAGLTNKSKT